MPNTLARSLRARRTDTIALLLPDMTNPFFTELAHGVEAAAREAGITMILANSDERADEEQRLVQMLLQRQVDGLLVVPAGDGSETIELCRERGVPLVVVDRRPQDGERRCRALRLRGRARYALGPAARGAGSPSDGRAVGPGGRPDGCRSCRGLPTGRRRGGGAAGAARPPWCLQDRQRDAR